MPFIPRAIHALQVLPSTFRNASVRSLMHKTQEAEWGITLYSCPQDARNALRFQQALTPTDSPFLGTVRVWWTLEQHAGCRLNKSKKNQQLHRAAQECCNNHHHAVKDRFERQCVSYQRRALTTMLRRGSTRFACACCAISGRQSSSPRYAGSD